MPTTSARRTRLLLSSLLCAGALCAASARADDPSPEIQRLLAAGHWEQALQRLTPLQQQSPNDPRWAFDRALALAGSGDRNGAIDLYTDLTQRYPELPEPYNNLGVLLAQQGRLQAAVQALKLALLANPQYGLARENLGDVELQRALADYTAALALPGHGTTLNDKLQRLRQAQLPPLQASPALTSHPILP